MLLPSDPFKERPHAVPIQNPAGCLAAVLATALFKVKFRGAGESAGAQIPYLILFLLPTSQRPRNLSPGPRENQVCLKMGSRGRTQVCECEQPLLEKEEEDLQSPR